MLGTDEKAWVPYLGGRISLVQAGLPKMILNVQAGFMNTCWLHLELP